MVSKQGVHLNRMSQIVEKGAAAMGSLFLVVSQMFWKQ